MPDGGWPHLLRTAVAAAMLWAIAGFAMTALLLPRIDPQCSSGPGARVCPMDPDPAISHRFDPAWPRIPELRGAAVLVVSMLPGVAIALFIDTSAPWPKTGGAPPVAGFLAGLPDPSDWNRGGDVPVRYQDDAGEHFVRARLNTYAHRIPVPGTHVNVFTDGDGDGDLLVELDRAHPLEYHPDNRPYESDSSGGGN
ncbi:hypothetical protein DVA86_24570 [Streptomyces armeniacus]|uniref:Uncharacterized protein n=1 Tax=Streptomyces armeniacus TaxID=83291 RepID=A0A345XUN1_9ACTN|nr:hypothetical protein [Streptomyces armeniacus]AXK35347.1 hypothetical protein DVA86_24570 [Streptomyces armeniacus]